MSRFFIVQCVFVACCRDT